ncbi:bacillithiol biosynthesis deacetylase BshB1 [Heliorestis convoluta]|uniref:Bacillithiol biosynthesis deacetylase BshB1 n=1 Tax=Heliorestis convoluta TaxID=356322 RepID=A0A5Q2N5H9_9FIRM|nr:bacillithiol biosynthesis deacetylase BshB1 [Heliorestis convoluta]QGG47835.1 bacillithiol biosynthesis deacetylase BshB1 [Heliorestis convoluta]
MIEAGQSSGLKVYSALPFNALPRCHILAIGAHPDDIELSVGGTIALATRQGHTVVVVDVTQGDKGTNGSAEIRIEESRRAAQVLGLAERWNCCWPDGAVSDPLYWAERIETLVQLLRRYRPQVVLAPGGRDRHPDHEGTSELARQAIFYAGLAKYEGATLSIEELGEPWRPQHFYTYRLNGSLLEGMEQPLLVDVSSVYEWKKKSILEYKSQFSQGWQQQCENLGIPHLLHWLVGRDQYLGGLVRVAYAEPLYGEKPFLIKKVAALWE